MKKIVIVEDDVFMREEIVNILQKASYGTECITDFLSPADSILAGDPDLVILDLNLPGLSGFAVCRMLRQTTACVILSSALVASSSSSTRGSSAMARARRIRCFCPPERVSKDSLSTVSIPIGIASISAFSPTRSSAASAAARLGAREVIITFS